MIDPSLSAQIRSQLPHLALDDGASDDELVRQLLAAHRSLQHEMAHVTTSLDLISARILQYAQGNFEIADAEETFDHDLVDSIALGMNYLVEEILTQQRDLMLARDQALAASTAKSAFLASMSHELRTPLNAIIGYSELIADDAAQVGNQELLDDVRKILSSGRSLLALITDVLDLSKVEAGKTEVLIEPFSLYPLVIDVVETMMPAALDKGTELKWHCDDAVVKTDSGKLRQILLNLVSNAVKFTIEGNVSIQVRVEGGELRATVTDTGIGIPQDRLASIFEAFTQADRETHRNHGGTGLGLTITQRFCTVLGGSISVESTVGVGSTFEVRLPIEAVSKLTPVMIPSRVQRGGEVLVIDDDPSVPELVQRHLAAIGAQVRWARSGTEGIAMALRQRPSLITLDVLLPDLSGWEVLNEVKRHPDLCEIPVVMMSIVPEASQAAVLGAQEFLVKPVDRQRLLKAVLRFLPDDRVEGEILVVDDQPLVREVLERNLTVAGHHVRLAADGIEALESIRSHRPDLILLDLMMPRMDGFEVIARLRDDPKLSTIPVVVLTAMELSPADRRRFSAGVASVLSKTQPTSTVLDTVRWALKAQAAGEKG